jgi:toxin ParE1/3/4
MSRFILSPVAEQDILSILAWTHQQFGEQTRVRYEALLVQAILDVAGDPGRSGVAQRDEICEKAFTYHLGHSRHNVDKSVGRIRKPRHLLLFRVAEDGVEIGRVLHDSMDLERHLPTEFLEE